MLQEVDTLSVELQHLVDGNAGAFLRIHTAGMVALVAEPVEIPETLSMDKYRLELLRAEISYLSLASAMIAVLKNVARHFPLVSMPLHLGPTP